MLAEEVDQLTIFDVIYEFDESKANWTDVIGHFEKCTVLAYIPKDALAPTEIPYKLGSKEFKYHKQIWSDYCTAIWHQIGFAENAWEIALRKLKEYRDEGKPCPMDIHRSKSDDEFRPTHVVEYL